jgi:hypothetical protein
MKLQFIATVFEKRERENATSTTLTSTNAEIAIYHSPKDAKHFGPVRGTEGESNKFFRVTIEEVPYSEASNGTTIEDYAS